MTSDRELLGLAAKAVGIDSDSARFINNSPGMWFHNDARQHPMCRKPNRAGNVPWNPMLDDGDAHRLAVKLGINILHSLQNGDVVAGRSGITGFRVSYGDDANAATRRAITEAAAEIGRGMA